MEYIAIQKFTRQSPRKVRLVATQVKSKDLVEVLRQLAVIERKSTLVLLKTIKQAMANAINNHGLAATDLELKSLEVNEGPRYRRFRAVSRGRAHGIIKRTCHVKAVLQAKTAEVAPEAESTSTSAAKTSKTETKAAPAAKKPAAKAAKSTKSTKETKTTKTTTKKKGS